MVFKRGNWKFANTRTAFGEVLLELGREDKDIVALTDQPMGQVAADKACTASDQGFQ